MQIDELDEWQGMTPEHINDWLHAHGWQQTKPRWWEKGEDGFLFDPQTFDQVWFWLYALAAVHNTNIQGMLREINPRMRNGMPSAAAIAAHEVSGGNWLAQSAQKGGVLRVLNWSVSDDRAKLNTLDTSQKIPRDMVPGSWCFWSCDEHGNKVRWPTDSEGKML